MKMITAEIIVLYYVDRKVDVIISIQNNYVFLAEIIMITCAKPHQHTH